MVIVMGADKGATIETLGLFLILVIGLALTPTISTALVDSKYSAFTENDTVQPLVANTTTTYYEGRNDSTTYAWFTIILNDTTTYGTYTLDYTNFTYTTATKLITFKANVLDDGKIYNAQIKYYYLSVTGAGSALLDLVPLFWVIGLIAAITVVAIKKLHIG